jgi:prolipoprotein diacylglyceryltransferase
MEKINLYEYSGIVCPGAALIIGLALLNPEYLPLLKEMSIGAFGVFIIMAFILGHLISAIGNILEDTIIGKPEKHTNKFLKTKGYKKTSRDIYAMVAENKKMGRLDVFNRLYGFMRGLMISFAILFFCVDKYPCYFPMWLCLGLSGLSYYRMVHFRELYKKELLAQYKLI